LNLSDSRTAFKEKKKRKLGKIVGANKQRARTWERL
jgi:hypothetical protein